MHPTLPTTGPAQKQLEKTTKASLGAFAISVIIHGAVLFTVGGYVITKTVIPKTPFQPVPQGAVVDDAPVLDMPEDTLHEPETPRLNNDLTTDTALPSEGETTSADILVSTGVNPTFSLPPAVGAVSAVPKLGWGGGGGGQTGAAGGGAASGKVIRSLFGQNTSVPAALRGTMYDLKQAKNGATTDQLKFLREFAAANFRRSMLKDYYQARQQLFATQLYIPNMRAEEAPKAFAAEKEVEPKNWIILYEGQFAAPDSGTYRFVGSADDVLLVRVNGKVVLDGSRVTSGSNNRPPAPFTDWKPGSGDILPASMGLQSGLLVNGSWMELQAGVNNTIEIVIGEIPGGYFGVYLFIEKQGKKYDTDPRRGGAPILPLFRTTRGEDDLPEGDNAKIHPAVDKRGPVFAPN